MRSCPDMVNKWLRQGSSSFVERPFRIRLSSAQLLQQRLGLLQMVRIKSFSEPAVDRREKITGFAAPVLFAPEARQADRCPQFQELCALQLRYRECLMIAPLGRGWIACGIQQIASQQMQRSLGLLPTHHRVAVAGSRSPSSTWRARDGSQTPSERDRIHVPGRDAALFVRRHASRRLKRSTQNLQLSTSSAGRLPHLLMDERT